MQISLSEFNKPNIFNPYSWDKIILNQLNKSIMVMLWRRM